MSKIRITLYDPQTNLATTDRLVEKALEYTNGPTDTHTGPIGINLILDNIEEVGDFKKYLDQLTGNLPINPKPKKSYKKDTEPEIFMKENPHEELLEEAIKKCKDQVQLSDYFRALNFRFITYQHLEELIADDRISIKNLNPKHKDYQFMIRVVKEAKDPSNDKYDPQLILGFKLFGSHVSKVKIYLYKKFKQTLILDWPQNHKVNFKKPEIMWKFPEYMTLEERRKWRVEYKKLQLKPELVPSKFYNRWKSDIKWLDKKN